MKEFENCKLCEWKCGVDRTKEMGVCNIKRPEVAYTCLSKPLKSYSINLVGCNFRCLFCDAYQISQSLNTKWYYRGYIEPKDLAKESANRIKSAGVERMTFTGAEASINLPYIEEVVKEIKRILPELKIGISTNGFETEESMERIVNICSYITFEIKAFKNETYLALTGAPVGPVLRNAEYLLKHREKIRNFRTVVIPKINDGEIEDMARFIASFDPSVPFHLIGFKPFFVLFDHPGPTSSELEELANRCRKYLDNVIWFGGYPDKVEFKEAGAAFVKKYLELVSIKRVECASKGKKCESCELDKSCAGSYAILKKGIKS